MRRRPAGRHDAGTGVFGSSFALTVFLVFLLFAVQVLVGLYARTTVSAVATDVAQRAANEGAALTPDRFPHYEAEVRRRLGGYGDDAEVRMSITDADLDGIGDTVAVRVRARLPLLLPVRWSGDTPGLFTRTMRARLEIFQEAA